MFTANYSRTNLRRQRRPTSNVGIRLRYDLPIDITNILSIYFQKEYKVQSLTILLSCVIRFT